MDLSNGSQSDDDGNNAAVLNRPVAAAVPLQLSKPKELPNSEDRCAKDEEMKPKEIFTKTPDILFDQKAVDMAVMKTVLQLLERYRISPDQLSDDQLKSYITYVIGYVPYQINLRSTSVQSEDSADSCHSR